MHKKEKSYHSEKKLVNPIQVNITSLNVQIHALRINLQKLSSFTHARIFKFIIFSKPCLFHRLTIPMLRLLSSLSTRTQSFFENHLNPVMLVFIGKLMMSTLRWVPIYQGLNHFQVFSIIFVLEKLATSSIRVNKYCQLSTCSSQSHY